MELFIDVVSFAVVMMAAQAAVDNGYNALIVSIVGAVVLMLVMAAARGIGKLAKKH